MVLIDAALAGIGLAACQSDIRLDVVRLLPLTTRYPVMRLQTHVLRVEILRRSIDPADQHYRFRQRSHPAIGDSDRLLIQRDRFRHSDLVPF